MRDAPLRQESTMKGGRNMTESIPVNLLERWISELQSILKAEIPKGKADLTLNQGMRHGLDQIQSRLNTWLRHQENIQALNRSGEKFLITKDVDLSDGRYRKLEWYQDNLFVVLAWRHGKHEETGELMLEIQDTGTCPRRTSCIRAVHPLMIWLDLAREGGLEALRNEGNRQEWVEKVWT